MAQLLWASGEHAFNTKYFADACTLSSDVQVYSGTMRHLYLVCLQVQQSSTGCTSKPRCFRYLSTFGTTENKYCHVFRIFVSTWYWSIRSLGTPSSLWNLVVNKESYHHFFQVIIQCLSSDKDLHHITSFFAAYTSFNRVPGHYIKSGPKA